MKRFTMKRITALALALIMTLSLCPVTAFAAIGEDDKHVCDDPDSYCLVCDVAEKINALPDVVSVDNAADVTEQIHAIDRIKVELTDDQYEEMLTLVDTRPNSSGFGGLAEPVRYMDTLFALAELDAGGSLYIQKKYSLGDAELDQTMSDATFSIECIDEGSSFATLNVTLAENEESYLAALDGSFYSYDESGWTNRYILPAGTYRITETGYHAVTTDGDELTTSPSYVVGDETSADSAIVVVEEGGSSAVTVLNLNSPSDVTGVTVNKSNTSITVGGVEQLTATVEPNNATDKTVTWSSNAQSVATVSDTGLVTAVAPGTATITATTNDGSHTATCIVTVTAKVVTPTIMLSPASFIYNGGEQKPTVTVKDGSTELDPSTDYDITWPVDCANVGTKTITVTLKGNYSGNKTAEYAIVAADSSCTAPAAVADLVYTGAAQNLVTAATPTGGTVQYGLSATGTFSSNLPAGTNAGSYNVYYKVVGDANHNDTAVLGPVQVTIAKAAKAAPVNVGKTDETVNNKNDGTITGVDSTMEYRKDGETTYKAIVGDKVENLSDGKYFVRYKEVANYNASPDAEVTIAAGRVVNNGGYPIVPPNETPEADPVAKPEVKPEVTPTTPPAEEVVTPESEDITPEVVPEPPADDGAVDGTPGDDVPEEDNSGADVWIAISLFALVAIILLLIILIVRKKRKEEQ